MEPAGASYISRGRSKRVRSEERDGGEHVAVEGSVKLVVGTSTLSTQPTDWRSTTSFRMVAHQSESLSTTSYRKQNARNFRVDRVPGGRLSI